jgi:hypothetical protein
MTARVVTAPVAAIPIRTDIVAWPPCSIDSTKRFVVINGIPAITIAISRRYATG